MSGDEPVEAQNDKAEAIRWRIRPSDKDPQKLIAIGAAGVLAFLIGLFLFKNLLLGFVGFAIIFGSTAEFWLGTSFSIDRKGASARTGFSISAIEWTDVKRVLRDSNGIKLTPLGKAGTMDAFRGVYLRYGKDNREAIERAVVDFGKHSDNDVVDRPDGGRDRSPD
jgi:hypothetical protein